MTKKRLLKAMAIATIATGLVACSANSSESTDDTTVATPVVTSGAAVSGATTVVNAATVKANASYTIGYGMGSSISEDENLKGFGINNAKVLAGFEDAINKKDPAVSQADMDKNMTDLREQMMEKMNAEKVSSFLKVSDSIYNSDLTPKTDVKDPAVVIYEFFDYQCMYCSKVSPEIDKAMADHKDTQVAFVEFPIFGERAPASEYAAEVGTAVYKLNGSAAYVKYHDGIFATGEDEGKLKNETVDKVAKDAGADIDKVKAAIKDDKIAEHLKATLEMGFKDLGIQGTPYIVVAPAKDADASNTTVIAGYSDQAGITAAIIKAKTAKA
ncbi:thioredoxin domain-containing protein [Francisellaceae bacterium CB299]|jgi:protein-disulfide isomerase